MPRRTSNMSRHEGLPAIQLKEALPVPTFALALLKHSPKAVVGKKQPKVNFYFHTFASKTVRSVPRMVRTARLHLKKERAGP